MPEYVGNLHVHTPYSDGEGNHRDVADMALLSGLDFVVFTDHNLWVGGIDGYYGDEQRGYVLVMAGEEVHDRARAPQCNHTLVYGAGQEMAQHGHSLATLINETKQRGGLTFIAHPCDTEIEWMREPGLRWEDQFVDGFNGLEIWNYMSDFKPYLQVKREAYRNVFRPDEVMIGPAAATLELWDKLLGEGKTVVGIGGADAHGTRMQKGPVKHTIFPYDFLFNCVNTHVLTKFPLVGETQHDKEQIFQALEQGRAFIGYDIPGPTRGFRYSAQGQNQSVVMGERIRLGHGVTLQVLAPGPARIKIIRCGEVVAESSHVESLSHVAREEGAYRVEVWRTYHGVERAWILSNPIYVEPNPSKLTRSTGQYDTVKI